MIASAALALSGWGSPLAVAHLVFAVGIVPLIFAAMMHFVPVLTRTGDIGLRMARLPTVAQSVGLVAVSGMQGWLPYGMVYFAAVCDLLAAGILLNWIASRVRKTLGSPHPGWRWYGVAIGCLILALGSILLIPFWPSYWRALRVFHLHLNTLGLVGLAALGTLPVLLPTALGKPDPEAASWLRRRLWLVASGALLIATGAVIAWPFAAPGAALVLVATLGLVGQWVRRFGITPLLRDGAAASLLCAVLGLLVALVAGLLHGAGMLPTRPSLLAWGAGFLLPLVTGALSQLLPVWRWPGPVTPERLSMRQKLAVTGAVRGGLFVGAAFALLAGRPLLGGGMVMAGLALFVIALAQAVRVQRPTR
ncbi:hypothetical protein LZ012_12030 [Dechloromonas sp. XY25]|uniref:Uncharacterized protein n=1 Tax=Dechloromonas hankyongensis TaxID=2908002 RepID=A0ABS9K3G6_9RHOO|nr:hypothetical protein [Dechloromonas hankyongensis]MCG2577722.1 hypothetical protein [Dechloromonas hankyongensis]